MTPFRKLAPMAAGQRYNRLTAMERLGSNRNGMSIWRFRCDCGYLIEVSASSVRTENTKSCGCIRSEGGTKNRKHGMSSSKIYHAWHKMLMRCINPTVKAYPYYGGRGVTICERWHKFENFYADMGPRPSPKHSIERIDNDGNYCPENCKWVTMAEQNSNKRNNIVVEFWGEKMCLAEAARRAGIRYTTLKRRIVELKWSLERALTEPTGYWRRK